jgi:hypothetical protein
MSDPILDEQYDNEQTRAIESVVGNFGIGLILRAVVSLVIDEINILRAFHGLPLRTMGQAKAAVKSKIQNREVDE